MKDGYCPFLYYLKGVRNRTKKKYGQEGLSQINLTKDILKDVWEKQKGICPYTGVQLIHPNYRGQNDPLRTASLDRIDSLFGYDANNVQFISISSNNAKNKMSHDQMLEFIRLIQSST